MQTINQNPTAATATHFSAVAAALRVDRAGQEVVTSKPPGFEPAPPWT